LRYRDFLWCRNYPAQLDFFCPTFFHFFLFLLLYTPTMKLINLLFPRQCINCSTTEAYLCKTCKKKLTPHPEICPYCHRVSKDYKTCIECRTYKSNNLEGIIIPFAYTDLLKKLIIKLKYFHKKDIGKFLVERLMVALQVNQNLNENIIISFIPSHWYRHYFVKWYNQSELLARKLSEKLQVPMVTIAQKKKHTKTQASLDRNWRLHNLKNTFSLAKNLQLQGNETLLIVDDITTTGSTINELAKLIKYYYPKIKVWWAVLWRHM